MSHPTAAIDRMQAPFTFCARLLFLFSARGKTAFVNIDTAQR